MDKQLRDALWEKQDKKLVLQKTKELIGNNKDLEKLGLDWWEELTGKSHKSTTINASLAAGLEALGEDIEEWPWQFWFYLGRYLGISEQKGQGKIEGPIIKKVRNTAISESRNVKASRIHSYPEAMRLHLVKNASAFGFSTEVLKKLQQSKMHDESDEEFEKRTPWKDSTWEKMCSNWNLQRESRK